MCNESDNGVLFYTKGTIYLCTGASCIRQGEDYCTGNLITEYYCTEKSGIKIIVLICPYGCDDGACLTRGQKPKPKVQQPQQLTVTENQSAEEQVKEIICDEGWQCVGKTKFYQGLDCSLVKETFCRYGCTGNECREPLFWEKFLMWLKGQMV